VTSSIRHTKVVLSRRDFALARVHRLVICKAPVLFVIETEIIDPHLVQLFYSSSAHPTKLCRDTGRHFFEASVIHTVLGFCIHSIIVDSFAPQEAIAIFKVRVVISLRILWRDILSSVGRLGIRVNGPQFREKWMAAGRTAPMLVAQETCGQ
jgi:hypothetical protein